MPRPDRLLGYSVALVQSAFAPEDYASAEAFAAKVRGLTDRVTALEPRPALVAFPELTGMWLPLFADGAARSIAGLARRWLARHPFQAAWSLLRGRGLSFVFLKDWRRCFAAWLEPFREAAVRHGMYVCPGSTFLPGIERNSTRDWELRDRRVYNTACLINPAGRLLCLTRKVHLTPDEVRLGISAGSPADIAPARTDIGHLGILICLDGFQETLVSRLDGAGAAVLIQPSANPVPWKAALRGPPASGTTPMSQEEQWLSQGIGSLIQGRECIRYSVNPMSVSRVLGHDDEGQSSVFENRPGGVRDRDLPYPGLVALAATWNTAEILHVAL